MPVKESSDELNPAVVVPDRSLGSTAGTHTFGDYLALSIATCGVGYLPLIPGTLGSLLGLGIFLLLVSRVNPFVIIVLILVITFAGIWAASRTEALSGRKDPGKVVV